MSGLPSFFVDYLHHLVHQLDWESLGRGSEKNFVLDYEMPIAL